MEHMESQTSVTEEDEDLEQLRLAALKSLKKPVGVYSEKVQQQRPFYNKNGMNRNRNNYHGRPHRNGQFNHRTRNSNLIAVPLISSDTEENNSQSSKLVLPQDRYCKANPTSDDKSEEQNSKFNRYNDKSESESESEDEETERTPKKLERANSLEVLMQELENEIEGRSNNEEKTTKTKVKKLKKKTDEAVVVVETKEIPKIEIPVVEPQQQKTVKAELKRNQVVKLETAYFPPQPQYYPVIPPYNPVPIVHYEPPRYERIPSPLTIDADLLNTTVTAPLSPRSAAFVLQNKEIIERRKRLSPLRRSYSRSPSTPRYNRRSRTRSRSPNTPPPPPSRRRTSPEKKSTSIYERLGARIGTLKGEQSPPKKKRSRSKTPPPKTTAAAPDAVLEARKKKFESNELKMKEGVIRLKLKNEQKEDEEDDVIDANIEDLFSDEETDDNDNEGRFKGKETQKSTTVLPYSKLTNKENRNEQKEQRPVSRKRPQISRLMLEKPKITPPVSTLPEKKIEIKIRNPTKYEEKKEQKEKVRKVEIGPRVEEDINNEPLEISEEEDGEIIHLNEGDLRTQLSRKRAERQSKISVVGDGVASRLLQSALESAVFKKATPKNKSATQRDGKVPIHSRLGVPVEVTTKKKRKRKSRSSGGSGGGSGGLEQV